MLRLRTTHHTLYMQGFLTAIQPLCPGGLRVHGGTPLFLVCVVVEDGLFWQDKNTWVRQVRRDKAKKWLCGCALACFAMTIHSDALAVVLVVRA